jgi:hypothetical protein
MRRKKHTPKTRALAELERLGWMADDAERVLRLGHRSNSWDLFGLFDIVAIKGRLTLGLQVTSDSNTSSRVAKMLAEPRLKTCLAAGWLCECWGVRTTATKDKSFAVARSFGIKGNDPVFYNWSDVLKY